MHMRDIIQLIENKIPVTPEIEELESIWAGGVADFGDKRAAHIIQKQPGYAVYVDGLRASLKFPLTVYRSMPREAYEDWYHDGHSDTWAVTTDRTMAEKFRSFAAHDKQERVVLAMIITEPRAVIMRGKAEESEIVVDSGWIRPDDTRID
jgi:hypothetical protein